MKMRRNIDKWHFKKLSCLCLQVGLFIIGGVLDGHGSEEEPAFFPSSSDSSKYSSEAEEEVGISNELNKAIEGVDLSDVETIHLFTFNIGQGNFVALRHGKHITIIDVGDTINLKIKEEEFQEVLRKICDGADITSVVITHTHKDHLGGLGNLLRWLQSTRKNEGKIVKLPKITFFLSDTLACHKIKGEDLSVVVDRFCSAGSVYRYRIDGGLNWSIPADVANSEITSAIFDERSTESISKGVVRAEFLNPTSPITVKTDEENHQSLIFRVTFYGKTVLFTGDATEKTFNAIVGDVSSSSRIKSECVINRNLLRGIHFLLAPHHGSGSEGSPLWLNYINTQNYYNFVGVIFSAPIESPFGHPNQYIGMLPIFNPVWLHPIVYNRERVDTPPSPKRPKKDSFMPMQKRTHDPIFQTSLVPVAHWLKMDRSGMYIYNFDTKSFHQLVSAEGWSMRLQNLLDAFSSIDDIPFAYAMGAFLQTPKIFKTRNADGLTCFEWLLMAAEKESEAGKYRNILQNIMRVAQIVSRDHDALRTLTPLQDCLMLPKMGVEDFCRTYLLEKDIAEDKIGALSKRIRDVTGIELLLPLPAAAAAAAAAAE